MKKVIQYILIIILFSAWGIILTNKESAKKTFTQLTGINKPCSQPIEYSIGSIDPRFGITQGQFQQDTMQAEKVWEDPVGKELFKYNPSAPLKLNLVFDEREQQALESQKIENQLESLNSAHESTLKEYASLSSSYKQKLEAYNVKIASYNKELDKYNQAVAYWNSQGGAPKDEYDKLKKENKNLKDTQAELEKERQAINALAQKTNGAANKENNLVDAYNSNLETYQSKFGEAREFEKGTYDGKEINIYEFKENSDLLMTIIHEFGHALGIGHLNDPKSIMYYFMGEQDLDNPQLTAEDLNALKSTCSLN